MKRFVVALAAAILAVMPVVSIAEDPKPANYGKTPKVGDQFPNFTGKTYDGKDIDLASYRGKVTLVDFWATWCPPCRAELPNMKKAYAAFHDKGFEIVGISLDKGIEPLQKWYEDPAKTLPWPSTVDGKYWQTELAQRYGIQSIPAPFLLDKDGKVIAAGEQVRGAALAKRLGTLLDPNYVAAPSMQELMAKWDKAGAAERPAIEKMLITASVDEQESVNEVAWTALDEGKPTPELGKLCLSMLEPTITEGKDFGALDTAAYAAYVAGDAAVAEKLQSKALASLTEAMKAGGVEDPMKIPPYVELSIRHGIYLAKSGRMDEAKKLAASISAAMSSNPQVAELGESKYAMMMQQAISGK